jgi:hypothetical protein
MNGLLDRFALILHRRFMLVSFLPVLIFAGGLFTLVLVASRSGRPLLGWWSGLPGSLQIVVVLAVLAAVWLLAGFVDSQSRNFIQLFEGYPLEKLVPRLYERVAAWHTTYRALMTAPEGSDEHLEAIALLNKRTVRHAARFSEESFVLYPQEDENILPTRLGNILRAAEDHSENHYDIDYLIIWPRLAHMCSERFTEEYEDARAKLEFLLVVSTLAGLFAFAGGTLLLVFEASPLSFTAVVLGGAGIAWLAYTSAVHAAIEYGEKMRASIDLYRLDLLQQLRYPAPRSLAEEQRYWREFGQLFEGTDRRTPYASPPPPAGDGQAAR